MSGNHFQAVFDKFNLSYDKSVLEVSLEKLLKICKFAFQEVERNFKKPGLNNGDIERSFEQVVSICLECI